MAPINNPIPQTRTRGARPWQWVALAGWVLLLVAPALLDDRAGATRQVAYIGPGAGFALLGSFVAVAVAVLSAVATIITWPLRRLWLAIRGRRAYARARVKRVVIIGLDGFDPHRTEAYLDQGLLPHLDNLRASGGYARLATTSPPLSPVAWASFSTGTNPGKHRIYDFLARDRADYRAALSWVRLRAPRRFWRWGAYRLPLERPSLTLRRRSQPFWKTLGEAGLFSAVLRVPVTFPPERFHGVQLAGLGVPDLLGSQGTFSIHVEDGAPGPVGDGEERGQRLRVQRRGDLVEGALVGPAHPWRTDGRPLRVPFRIHRGTGDGAVLQIQGRRVPLPVDGFSDWIRVGFRAGPFTRVRGICRARLTRFGPPFAMYVTPIQIDPDRPALPISHPRVFAPYLARSIGPFATLGLAEDTGAFSAGALSREAFLQQVEILHQERERMLFDTLRRVRRGLVVCVFDAPDRVQHVCWPAAHEVGAAGAAPAPAAQRTPPPANGGRRSRGDETRVPRPAQERNARPESQAVASAEQETILRDLYRRMDETIGKVRRELGRDTALFVMSDHGFTSFRRAVDLNAWLREHGYLHLKEEPVAAGESARADIDWSRTRAYAMGLTGLYLNLRGREAQGIVPPGAPAEELRTELKEQLGRLTDPADGAPAIRAVEETSRLYRGPYAGEAPDLVVGYADGYRASWDTAVGRCGSAVFRDNTRRWCGDHSVHADLVPGVLFSNRRLRDGRPHITDLAPTVLDLFGVPAPSYLDGRTLLPDEPPL